MAIAAPSRTPIGNRALNSDFVLCESFAFRPANVDGFSHQTFEDGTAVTSVNYKGYTQTISDSDRRLFDFLITKLNPTPTDENA